MPEGAGQGKKNNSTKTDNLGFSRNLPEVGYTDFVSASSDH
jgi:hypothetical protein